MGKAYGSRRSAPNQGAATALRRPPAGLATRHLNRTSVDRFPWDDHGMRADRLVAILLLLQTRDQVTAAEVAAELEISERTARRDLDALSMAGVPVYSKQGRNGGWRLIGGAKTDLSGLTADEARALFLVAGPLTGATPEVKAALRKLVRALPEPFRKDAEAASNAVVVDPAAWGEHKDTTPPPKYLDLLQRAVVDGEQVELGYVARDRAASTRTVHPLGLAAKGAVWYLVAGTDAGMRTFRVDRVTAAELTGEPVERPEGFDLEAAWKLIAEEVDQKRAAQWAHGRTQPGAIDYLRHTFGVLVRIGPADDAGNVPFEVGGHNARSLAGDLAKFGRWLEVEGPEEVLHELRGLARELSARYGSN
jgi:predicted DNA-binding transcriptional regulator YafY